MEGIQAEPVQPPPLSIEDDDEEIEESSDEEGLEGSQGRKKRLQLTREQKQSLNYIFKLQKRPDRNLQEWISSKLKLKNKRVRVWFQNQRAREKQKLGNRDQGINFCDAPDSFISDLQKYRTLHQGSLSGSEGKDTLSRSGGAVSGFITSDLCLSGSNKSTGWSLSGSQRNSPSFSKTTSEGGGGGGGGGSLLSHHVLPSPNLEGSGELSLVAPIPISYPNSQNNGNVNVPCKANSGPQLPLPSFQMPPLIPSHSSYTSLSTSGISSQSHLLSSMHMLQHPLHRSGPSKSTGSFSDFSQSSHPLSQGLSNFSVELPAILNSGDHPHPHQHHHHHHHHHQLSPPSHNRLGDLSISGGATLSPSLSMEAEEKVNAIITQSKSIITKNSPSFSNLINEATNAIREKQFSMVEVVFSKLSFSHVEKQTQISLLKMCVRNDDHGILILLCSLGAEPHIRDEEGNTLLHFASIASHSSMIFHTLLALGVDYRQINSDGLCPIHICCDYKNEVGFNILISRVPEVEFRDHQGRSLLYCAINSGSLRIVEKLLKMGAICSSMSLNGDTPLHRIVAEQKDPRLQLSLFSLVATHSSDKLEKLCLLRNIKGETLLHLASFVGSLEFVKVLVEAGFDPTACSLSNHNPKDIAAVKGFANIVRFLEAVEFRTPIGRGPVSGGLRMVS